MLEMRHFLLKPYLCLLHAHQRGATLASLPNFAMSYLTRALRGKKSDAIPPLFASFRTMYCGAEPIREQTVETFLETAVPLGLRPDALVFCYGLAEATLLVTSHRFRGLRESFDRSVTKWPVASVGMPASVAELKLEAAPGQVANIQIRGDTVFPGYWHAAPRVPHEWFDTGDMGYMVGDELFVCGRKADRFKVNGEVVFTNDIESVVLQTCEVRECLVMPEDDQFHVLIVPDARCSVTEQDVAKSITRALGMAPASVVRAVPDEILRTASRKPRREATLARLRDTARLGHRG